LIYKLFFSSRYNEKNKTTFTDDSEVLQIFKQYFASLEHSISTISPDDDSTSHSTEFEILVSTGYYFF